MHSENFRRAQPAEAADLRNSTRAECLTRDGWALADCNLSVWRKLKTKGLIASYGGGPYQVNREEQARMRAQLDNRVSARAAGDQRRHSGARMRLER